MMRAKTIPLLLLIVASRSFVDVLAVPVFNRAAVNQQSINRSQLPPDAAQYLDFLREEQDELEFQLPRGEITLPLYQRALSRIEILRALVMNYCHRRSLSKTPMSLPDYMVVPAAELDNLIANGHEKLRGARAGLIVDNKWRFLKTVPRHELFYVFERVTNNNNDAAASEAISQ